MDSNSGANTGCASGDCEGEEQEDPSSSSLVGDVIESRDAHINVEDTVEQNASPADELSTFREQWQHELESSVAEDEADKTFEELPSDHEAEPPQVLSRSPSRTDDDAVDDELAEFRQQWQRELESTPTPQRELETAPEIEPIDDEERAKKLFLKGAELERGGKLYEAVQHYKRAMAIVPDIEIRLYESTKGTETPQEEAEPVQEVEVNTTRDDDDDEEMVEGEELVSRLLRINARKPLYCQPAVPTKEAHISWLPYEVLRAVLRWVVSAELDAGSLERCGAACRALLLAARDPDLWRAICVQTWGIECGSPRSHNFGSWREMYINRPRLQLHGCYISKTTYLRPGENSFQDHLYRPWYLIDYYRYLRFFADGLVLMWTTADEPASCVGHLRYKFVKSGLGIMAGHYRLIGDKVVIVIKKTSSEKKQIPTSNTRFRSRRKEPEQEQTQTFHLELEVRALRHRRHSALWWRGYSACTRRDQWTQFELSAAAFPPFAFSAVRSYAAHAHAPLRTQRRD